MAYISHRKLALRTFRTKRPHLLLKIVEFFLKFAKLVLEMIQLVRGRYVRRNREGAKEVNNVRDLGAAEFPSERGHRRALAVEYAHDQLGILPALLPRMIGEIRDRKQVLPHRLAAAIPIVAPYTRVMEEPASFSNAQVIPRLARRGRSQMVWARGCRTRHWSGQRRRRRRFVLNDLLASLEPPHERDHLLDVERAQLGPHPGHRLAFPLQDRTTQFLVGASGVPSRVREVRDFRGFLAREFTTPIGLVADHARRTIDLDRRPTRGRRRGRFRGRDVRAGSFFPRSFPSRWDHEAAAPARPNASRSRRWGSKPPSPRPHGRRMALARLARVQCVRENWLSEETSGLQSQLPDPREP